MRDVRQSASYAKYLEMTGWEVEELGGNYYFVKKFPLIGSFVKLQRPEEINLEDIEKIAKKYRAFRIIVEPHFTEASRGKPSNQKLQDGGFRRLKIPYLPSKTIEIDLTKSLIRTFNGMKKDARYCLRKTEGQKNLVREINYKEFYFAWRQVVGVRRYRMSMSELSSLKNAFQNDVIFLLSSDGSGACFLKALGKAYYWQAFTSKLGRKSYSQYRLLWDGMVWAKGSGAKTLDLEGIYDERFPLPTWKGFTHFKKSFGGKEVRYPGAWGRYRMPI